MRDCLGHGRPLQGVGYKLIWAMPPGACCHLAARAETECPPSWSKDLDRSLIRAKTLYLNFAKWISRMRMLGVQHLYNVNHKFEWSTGQVHPAQALVLSAAESLIPGHETSALEQGT